MCLKNGNWLIEYDWLIDWLSKRFFFFTEDEYCISLHKKGIDY